MSTKIQLAVDGILDNFHGRSGIGNQFDMLKFEDPEIYEEIRSMMIQKIEEAINVSTAPKLIEARAAHYLMHYFCIPWEEAQRISDLPEVDEAIRGLLSDPTGDNATSMVRTVMAANMPTDDLHPTTQDLVARFTKAVYDKLASAEKKYGYSDNWARKDWMDECRHELMEHIKKGDPRDVAAYCAFLWHHGASTNAG